MHTDQSLVDITVGDPEIADVNPLTDHALSILGKKIGTTRVTVYGEDKKTVGIFDVEVSYDISRLNAEIARFAGGGIRVSSVNGRILLSGTVADAVTLDKAVTIARQFVPDVINTVQVHAGRSRSCWRCASSKSSRQASRELGVQWNMFGSSALANVGYQLPAAQLPITQPGGAFQQPAAANSGIGGASLLSSDTTGTPLSPVVAAGVLSGAAPFGFLVSQLSNALQSVDQRARAEGPRPQPGGAQSGGFVGRYRKLPRRRTVSRPGGRRGSAPSRSLTSHTASGCPSPRPCSGTA